jgi:integrase
VTTAISTYLSRRSNLDQQNPTDTPLFARHDKRASKRVLPISRWTGANIVENWVNYALDASIRAQLDSEKITITPHSFRHYFILDALAQTDHDIAATQTLARHGDRSTTRRYLHRITASTSSINKRKTGE